MNFFIYFLLILTIFLDISFIYLFYVFNHIEIHTADFFMEGYKVIWVTVMAFFVSIYAILRICKNHLSIELWRDLKRDPMKENVKQEFFFNVFLFIYETTLLIVCVTVWYIFDPTKKRIRHVINHDLDTSS